MISRLLLFALCGCLHFTAAAQASFVERNDLLAVHNINSAVPVAIADMNGDHLDDIISMDDGRKLVIQYQVPDRERPFLSFRPLRTLAIGEQNDILIGDFNNDQVNDILMSGTYDDIKLLYGAKNSYDYELVTIDADPFFSQGASTGDFNGDGWLDAVLLNDNGLNFTLMNDGAGNLVVDNYLNFVTVPISDNSGNYGSVYSDFDMDGDSDFYIAKCRQGVTNPADPRRINFLLENDGNNNYTETAAAYGLANGRQSWTADFGDYDNDGDMDLFLTQHDVLSELFENIDNDTFINVTSQAGLNIPGIPLQGMFRDFDNDGFQDILISGDRVDYYHNNGDKTFTELPLFGTTVFGTYAMGDLNDDGFTDIYASHVIPFNTPDQLREDKIYLNQGNDNHFISFLLKDNVNTSVIGATISLYGAWGIQIREVRGGEQYGVSNAHQMIFGLGEYTTYDSIVIRWPRGERTVYDQLAIDQKWVIHRDGCIQSEVKLWDDVAVICDTGSIVLNGVKGVDLTYWNTGEIGSSIEVDEHGIFYGTYTDLNGCIVTISPIEITKDPDTIKPVINYLGNTLLCNKEIAILSVSLGTSYQWSNGETTRVIEATETGDYYAAVQGYCIPLNSDTLHLEFLVPPSPVTTPDTFFLGQPAMLTAIGDSIVWYSDLSQTNIVGTGPVLTLDGLTETTTVYAENLQAIEGLEYNVGPAEQDGFPKYNGPTINGGLLFDVLAPIVLESFTVFTDSAGIRVIEFTDDGSFLYQHEVDLEPGMTVIDLNLELQPGSYKVTTNTASNMEHFGVTSPYLWRSDDGVLFPYDVENIFSLHNSTYGPEYFYYFYDWQVMSLDKYCGSDLVPVTAELDLGVGTHDEDSDAKTSIYPNPTNGKIIASATSGIKRLDVVHTTGKIIYSILPEQMGNEIEIDLSAFVPGVYFIKIYTTDFISLEKVTRL